MKPKTKKRVMLGVGLIAGFALGYYLNSPEGKELRKKAAAQLDDYGEELGGVVNELGSLANKYAEKAKAKGEEIVEEARAIGEAVAEKTKASVQAGKTWVAEQVEAASVADSFKRGVAKAKATLDPPQAGKEQT